MSEAESTIVPSRSNSTADQVRVGAMVWVGMGEVTVTSYGAMSAESFSGTRTTLGKFTGCALAVPEPAQNRRAWPLSMPRIAS